MNVDMISKCVTTWDGHLLTVCVTRFNAWENTIRQNDNFYSTQHLDIGSTCHVSRVCILHDDVIKWKHFPRNWPFVREIHRSPVNFPHKGQWRGALMFSLIYAWINDWVNNREAGDLRRQHGHYDVIVMIFFGQSVLRRGQLRASCNHTTGNWIIVIG